MKLSKGYEEEQHTLQEEQTSLEKELQKEEKQSVDVKQFLSVVRKYTNLTELTPEIVHEFIDKIIVHAPDKSTVNAYRKLKLFITISEYSTTQRSLCGKEKRYSTQHTIPQNLNLKNILTKPSHLLAIWI
ncbi:DUF4368 domain-containing protein [Clostridioides difficile]|nr:DUF4368 domain-containing protein [Clostridioides difficile]